MMGCRVLTETLPYLKIIFGACIPKHFSATDCQLSTPEFETVYPPETVYPQLELLYNVPGFVIGIVGFGNLDGAAQPP